MVQVSVIVPLYNVEKYVARAATSIARQIDEKTSGLEVILVDDGSPDSSLALALTLLEDSLPGLHVKAIRQENQGLGGARNTGLMAAEGEYAMFLDADDFLLPDAFAEIRKLIADENPDVIFGSYDLWTEKRGFARTKKAGTEPPLDPEQLTDWIVGKQPLVAWNAFRYVCRRGFLLRHGIFFETGVYCEDVEWSLKLLFALEGEGGRLAFLRKPHYAYNHRREGSIMNTVNPKRLVDINGIAARLLARHGDRVLVCRALVRESVFHANEYFLLDGEGRRAAFESYMKVMPLYPRSKFFAYALAGRLRHPSVFYVFSAALFAAKMLRRGTIGSCRALARIFHKKNAEGVNA